MGSCTFTGRSISLINCLAPAARLRAILWRHAVWRSNGQTGGVVYICADHEGRERITSVAADAGLVRGRGLRVELLDTINAQALAAYEEARPRRLCPDSAARRPVLAVDGS